MIIFVCFLSQYKNLNSFPIFLVKALLFRIASNFTISISSSISIYFHANTFFPYFAHNLWDKIYFRLNICKWYMIFFQHFWAFKFHFLEWSFFLLYYYTEIWCHTYICQKNLSIFFYIAITNGFNYNCCEKRKFTNLKPYIFRSFYVGT